MFDKEINISHKAIIFNTKGYDPFIDFIKAYAIICVLIAHTLPVGNLGYGLWAGMQVPLFLLVQAFHFYKKDDSQVDFKKLCQRILLPFAMISLIEILLLNFNNSDIECNKLIISGLINGGGMGQVPIFHLFIFKFHYYFPCLG